MKQLFLLFFAFGLIIATSFAATKYDSLGLTDEDKEELGISDEDVDEDEDEEKIVIEEMLKKQCYPLKELALSYFKDKLIVAFNMCKIEIPFSLDTKEDRLAAQKAIQVIQNLNKLQKKGNSSGQFVVIGCNFTNIEDELKFLQRIRPMFPIYEIFPADEEMFLLIDPSGNIIARYKDAKQCLSGLSRYTSAIANLKRIMNLPVQHPLESMKLSIKEIDILNAFEPGKPWSESYKKMENAIANPSKNTKKQLLRKIKDNVDKYLLITIPEVCQNAKTKPAANYEKLVLLSRSIKGLQGEENVSYALEPLQADKNVAELAKQLAIINNFMATMDNSKDNKKKIESFITPLRQFLNKPDLSARVKAEGVETLEQLVNMLPENDVNPEVRDYLQTAKASVKNEVEKEIANSENEPPKRIENANSKSTKNNNSDSAGKRMVKKINGVEFAFRWCPPGTFTMGSPDHKKQHKVSLTKGFWILETEITQKHVKAIMGQYFGVPKFKYKSKEAEKAVIDILLAHQGESLDKLTPKEKKTIGDAQIILDNYPVTGMSWKRCQEFCKKCKTLGLPVQLPTEAQWEYACRAGSDEPYAKGLEEGQAGDIVLYGEAVDKELLDELKKTLNHYNIYLENLDVYNPDRIRCDELEKCGIYDFIYPVGKTIPNKWGIYDMHSNADEWTLDEYAEYKGIAEINPINNKGYSDYHVIRGGRSGNRRPYSELEHLNRIGFRVIMAQ